MCGIAGIIGTPDRNSLEKMLQATKHRGPNHQGTYKDDFAALGMNRLAILDTSSAGNQPMHSSDGRYILVYNGEIYNFQILKQDLLKKGHFFNSNSDTEVLLKLYLEYGIKCLDKLRGMFAFFIWDIEEKKGFAARDHLGIKPFLFSHKNGVFTFCSEIKGLLATPYVDREIDSQALLHYLSMGFVTPSLTMLKSVRSLQSGHYLLLENGQLEIKPFWKLKGGYNTNLKSLQEAVDQTRGLLLQAVQEQLISDVPLGVFLSGGLDSTTIVAAMRKVGAPQIKTFSLGFEAIDNTFNETSLAAETAKFYETDHQNIIIQADEVARDFDHFIHALDQPSSDGLNSYFISKYTVKEVTVALSGLGGDEIFNGYGHVRSIYNTKNWKRLASKWLKQVDSVFGRKKWFINNERWQNWLNKENILQEYVNVFASVFFREAYQEQLLNPALYPDRFQVERDYLEWKLFCSNGTYSDLQKIGLLDLKAFMGSRLLRDADAITMYHSLELRPPFLDTRLLDFAFHLPDEYKLGPISDQANTYNSRGIKKLVFEAFKKELIPGIMDRKVSGFHIPIAYWMKTILREKMEDCFLNKIPPFFDAIQVSQLYHSWKEGKTPWRRIWLLFILFEWIHTFDIQAPTNN